MQSSAHEICAETEAEALEQRRTAVEVLVDRLEPADVVVTVGHQMHIEESGTAQITALNRN